MNREAVIESLIRAEREYGLTETLCRVFGGNLKVSIGFSKKACGADIDALELSVRSYNALRRADISTLGALIDRLNAGGLKNIRNLGDRSCKEIQTKILEYGYMRLSEKEKAEFFRDLLENNILPA
ncbi:MAG: DNA-directed RNA polymerase subunit alpha C-terminal domain-containing protein [Eubacteriales bacterium]